MGMIGLYPRFRADDRDGLPLEGGKLYSYLSGTSTPHSMYADAELTTPLANPIILDASGEALFYTNGQALKWVLTDQDDVLQWEIDPVAGGAGAGGNTGAAGLGWGKNTVVLTPGAGTAQAAAAVFPPDVLALGLTVWIQATLGTSQGLQQVGVGTAELPDCWGLLPSLTAATETTAGLFQGYGGQPMPTSGMVTLTAYGGLFDGAGTVYLTGHFLTLRPGHEPGYLYTSSTPEAGQILPPQPPASETTLGLVELATPAEVQAGTDTTRAVTPAGLSSRSATETRTGLAEVATTTEVTTGTDDTRLVTPLKLAQRLTAVAPPAASETVPGLVELATPAETLTGTDATRATHPAGVKAALDAGLAAKVPAGTPLSVVRYAASGTALETGSASVVIDASGRLGVGQATPVTPLHMMGELRVEAGFVRCNREAATASVILEASGDAVNSVYGGLTLARARGTTASRSAAQAGDRLALLAFQGYGTSMATSAQIDVVAEETFTASARGSRVALSTTTLGTTTLAERLRIDSQGAIGLHTTLSATLGSGASYAALSIKGSTLWLGQSSVQERPIGGITSSFSVPTDATRQGRLVLTVYDATAGREILRGDADGTTGKLGFLGAASIARPTVSGSRGGNAALASVLTALANFGLITDSTTA